MPVPQKSRQRSQGAGGFNDQHRWRVLAMSMKVLHDSLESGQREILAADRERWERMGAGGHLSDWMAFLPGMELRRTMAMKIAETNEPTGKGYAGALSALMMRDGLYDETTTTQPAKESFGAVLWFSAPPHRRQILQEVLRDMVPGQLARFNSPITARQRVKVIAIERGLEEAPKPRAVKPPKDDAVNRAKDLECENEHLREQLAAAQVEAVRQPIEQVGAAVAPPTPGPVTEWPHEAIEVARAIAAALARKPLEWIKDQADAIVGSYSVVQYKDVDKFEALYRPLDTSKAGDRETFIVGTGGSLEEVRRIAEDHWNNLETIASGSIVPPPAPTPDDDGMSPIVTAQAELAGAETAPPAADKPKAAGS